MSAWSVSPDGRIERVLPLIDELLTEVHVVALPMRVKFRGITARETMLIRGPVGWGEFGPFPEYADDEAANWLQSAVETAWQGPPDAERTRIPVNATVPAIDATQVAQVLARFPGATTAKVKVAEQGQTLRDDIARVDAVRAHVPNVRVDANGGWTVDEAERALAALGDLEYAEQPCRTVEELAELRTRTATKIAADESIRRADDPLRVKREGGLDIAVLKVAPMGGPRRLLNIAAELGTPIVISSALDSAVGMAAGLATAAALPHLDLACGLGTGGLFVEDVAETAVMSAGYIDVAPVVVDPVKLRRLAVPAERRQWWIDRIRRCRSILDSSVV